MTILKHIPLLDTNILVSFFIEDYNFIQAKEIISSQGGYINDFILCETLNYIQKKLSTFHVDEVYNEIRYRTENTYSFLEITSELRDKAHIIYQKYIDNNYTFTDCLIPAQAEQLGLKVYTSDIRMQNYKAVEVINPFA